MHAGKVSAKHKPGGLVARVTRVHLRGRQAHVRELRVQPSTAREHDVHNEIRLG